MAVAKSFEDFERLSEPFEENGKMYIMLRNPKTGTQRKARWYEQAPAAKKTKDDGFDNLRVVRGFGDGPILVVRNNKNEDEPWLIESPARYAMGIGWYFASNCELPEDAPPHFKYLLLDWEEASLDERHMKPQEELKKILSHKARAGEYVET